MTEREEHIICIRHPYVDKAKHSLCGRRLVGTFEFHFVSIDHWASDAMRKNGHEACPECLQVISALMPKEEPK